MGPFSIPWIHLFSDFPIKDRKSTLTSYVEITVIRSVIHIILTFSQMSGKTEVNLEDMTVEEFLSKKTRDVEEVRLIVRSYDQTIINHAKDMCGMIMRQYEEARNKELGRFENPPPASELHVGLLILRSGYDCHAEVHEGTPCESYICYQAEIGKRSW